MLTQKIIGTEYKKVKYHGNVKFLIFECNYCSKNFSKMESYCKKQLKIHKNACCFCSPDCRNDYFNKKSPLKTGKTINVQSPSSVTAQSRPPEAERSFFGWLDKIFNG